MIEFFKRLCLFLVISVIINVCSRKLQSNFLSAFMDANLITILLALMAINSTTNSVILTKLKDLSDKNKVNLKNTVKEMKVSIIEQLWLIILASFGLIVKKSEIVVKYYKSVDLVLDIFLVIIFCYSIHILYDTANAVFVILQHENNNKKE